LPRQAGPAAQVLLQAFEYAADCGVDPWQFAVELSELLASGMTRLDLRWLLCRAFAEHARETTLPGDPVRSFRRLPPTSIPEDACIVLTTPGATLLQSAVRSVASRQRSSDSAYAESDEDPQFSGGNPAIAAKECNTPTATASKPTEQPAVIPVWNSKLRELRYRGELVKRFRVPAPNQEMILTVFEEEGWPDCVDDPLPPVPDVAPKPRLRATIKSLNGKQNTPSLRFHVNQNGQIVTWEAAPP
jgi:hypothetical protein